MAQITHHEPGIYLNLPSDDYRQDPALGYNALKALLAGPAEWWWDSPLNTLLPEEETAAPHFDLGEALHVAYLESLEEYDRIYGVPPDAKDYPNHLNSGAQLQAECKALKLKASGTKDEMIERILEARPDAPLFNHVRDRWVEEGRRPIKADQDTRIRLLHRMLARSTTGVQLPDGQSVTLADAICGGLSEVSVFWTQDGIRQRARFDKLKPNISLDVKTINGWSAKDFKQALLREAVIRGYVLQAGHYQEARRQMKALFAEGKVFGASPEETETLREIASADQWAWGWIFAKTTGAPMVKAVIPKLPSPQFAKADRQRASALYNFSYYRDFFGLEPGNMWADPEVLWEPDHTDWPEWSELPESK